jgi:23S rRNA (pseudouridine1915-N3)-methyltransferase
MSRSVHLIAVGKLKDAHLISLENDYLKRISPSITIHEVKAKAENKNAEADEILKKLNELEKDQKCFKVALTERGQKFHSRSFADWTGRVIEDGTGKLVFMIAGAEGFSETLIKQCNMELSLSELTFPHKLARIILIEQLYRAQTIRAGHPYHN